MNGKKRVCTFFILVLLLTVSIHALNPNKKITQYELQIWNIKDGLPSNTIYAIQQTQDGYLWLGSDNGLIRFDGKTFDVYSKENTPEFIDNTIRTIYVDKRNTLWIGTTDGGLMEYKNGRFSVYSSSEYSSLSKIQTINEDRDGNIWIGSNTNGLTLLDKNGITSFTTKEGLPSNEIYQIYRDHSQNLWVSTKKGIIKIIAPGKFIHYGPPDFREIATFSCLYKTSTNELLMGTVKKGLTLLKNGKLSYITGDGLPYEIINSLYEDQEKNTWIATDGGGIVVLRDGEFQSLSIENGLADNYVYSIFQDNEGSLWFGTIDGGLHRLRDTKFSVITRKEGLKSGYINCIMESRKGSLWFGTKNGLHKLGKEKNREYGYRVETVFTIQNDPKEDPVLSLEEDAHGGLWIGTLEGLFLLKNNRLKSIQTTLEPKPDIVTCILVERQEGTWVGTLEGLKHLDARHNVVDVFTTKEGLSSNKVECLARDRDGRLWIGTEKGINTLENNTITSARMIDKEFLCIYEDSDGVLWFGTDSGMIRLAGQKETLYTSLENGLIENYVSSILEDSEGYFWLAGRKGILRISKQNLTDIASGKTSLVEFQWFTEKDGLKSRWCTSSAIKTKGGTLLFPTGIGAAAIDPANIKKNLRKPPVVIKRLMVDDKNVELNLNGVQEFFAGTKRFEFNYAGLTFINPSDVKYKIKLCGYENNWREMGNDRNATYTNLEAGEYTFSVIACNSDNICNQTGVSYSFIIRPFIWETTWFKVIAILLGIAIVLFVFRLRVAGLKRRKRELETLVEQRTSDLKERNVQLEKARQKLSQSKDQIEGKNRQLEDQSTKLKEMDKIKSRFFANISHEFRTPLTLIMGPMEQMLAEKGDERHKKTIMLMLRNSQRLLRLINQLLELSKFESGKIKLSASYQNAIPLLKGIVANFERIADENELELIFQSGLEEIQLYLDEEKLEDIFTNLLMNAVKFTPPGGKITLSVDVVAEKTHVFPFGFLRITVADTGPGIPRERLEYIFDRFYQVEGRHENREKGTGIGLALVKELVTVHLGKIDVFSREGRGTEFIVSLPLGNVEPLGSESSKTVEAMEMIKQVEAAVIEDEKEPAGEVQTAEKCETSDEVEVGKEIILVVEDNREVREYIGRALEPVYTVIEAGDGNEGVKQAFRVIPDLVISDVMMPGRDGYELCRELKRDVRTSHIPVILLTAKAADEDILEGLEEGADDYVVKPFNVKMLLARVHNLIEVRRRLQLRVNREMGLEGIERDVSKIDREFLGDLRKAIGKHLADPEFNVEALARVLIMDRSTVYRKVLALTGEVPTEFIRSCRLRKGKELLVGGMGSIVEVAFEVGFSSANYFSKCFKKKYRCLPSEYLNKI